MTCRTCGTEIADKAIVCYRCGTGTADPVRAPAPIGRRRPRASLTAPVLLLIAALALFAADRTAGIEAGWLRPAAAVCALAGLAALVVALSRRR